MSGAQDTMKLKTALKVFLLLTLLKLTSALELGYNVIEQTGKFCPSRDSCRIGGRGSRVSFDIC